MLRHGQSQWNLENKFTGWEDVSLSKNGVNEAIDAANLIQDQINFSFDIAYTSVLKRAIQTLNIVLEEINQMWLPVNKSWRLNERHYGGLQGLNKQETIQKFGEAQVQLWRRSYHVKPPKSDYFNFQDEKYKLVDRLDLPRCESLEDTVSRCIPYLRDCIEPEILKKKNILIVAHGNSLRALIKYLEGLSDQEIMKIEIPTGKPLVYILNNDLTVNGKYYLQSNSPDYAAIP